MKPAWFEEIADHLDDPLLLAGADGRVVAASRLARQHAGIEEGDDLTTRVDDPEGLRRFLGLASRSAQPLPGRLDLSGTPGGDWLCHGSRLRPTAGGGGALLALHLHRSDRLTARFAALDAQIEKLHGEIRRRMALEEERAELLEREREARQEAEEANRLKDEFLASVSHELRTPLNAITGWLELLKTNRDQDLLERGLEVMERNVKAQTQLTEDLMDISSVVAGRMRLDLQPIELGEVVNQAVDSVKPSIEAKGQRLEVVAAQDGCVVNADPDRIVQVVWNLLSNATKFTPKGGRIQLVLRRINSNAEIEVSDTGAGIPEDVLPYVFDRFRQADGSTTRRHGGLGLGLAIVRHLVELHGGMVMAHSDGPGQGATFTVNLPMPIFQRKPAATTPRRGEETAEPEDLLAGCTVLLVEDHDDSRELLERILAGAGARVTALAGANEALAAFEEERPDVLLSDIELPGDDGFTFVRKLRDRERQLGLAPVPAIAVTAHSIGHARVHALRSGYQTFLVKPVHPPELLALVKGMCEMGEEGFR